MIMPFLRLITIYVVVIIGVTAFFKRDQLMQFSSATIGWPSAQTSAGRSEAASNETTPAQALQSEAAQTEAEQSETTQAAPAAETKPTPPTASADVIRMPVADPQDQPGGTAQAAATSTTTKPAATKTAINTQARLKAARQAYWNGDLAGSGALYAALAKEAPNDPDVSGEFGNILYAQRRFDAAADAYFTTGKLLVKSGKTSQIQPIIAVLQNIAPQMAATLRALANN